MDEQTTAQAETVPTYGLLVINHAYNEGKITFSEWLQLSKAWAEAMQQDKPKMWYSERTNESVTQTPATPD